MRPRTCTALLAATLLAPATVLSACGGSEPAPNVPAASALQPCAKVPDLPSARCGTVEVPLDRANPSAGTTTVAFALVPRRDTAAPSAGTLAFNPGGPGDPTIANAAQTAKMFAPLLDHRDLLLIDPRGTGRSDALHCPTDDHPRLRDVFATPAQAFQAIGQCGRELGPRAANYGTTEVADDIDAVRAELGVDRLDLWGNSYGTYLMPVYAARHPEHVRSMVLSGAYPIDFDPWGRDRAAATRRAIGLICARTHGCHGDEVLRDVAALATRLRHHPVRFNVAVDTRQFRARLDENAVAALAYSGGSPYGLAQLPAVAASGSAGDLAPLRRIVETKLRTEAYGVTHPAPRAELPPPGLRDRVPRLPARVLARRPAGRPARRIRQGARLPRPARLRPVLRVRVDERGLRGGSNVHRVARRPLRRRADRAGHGHARCARAGHLRRPGREYAELRRPAGRLAIRPRHVRRDPQRRPCPDRRQPVRPEARGSVRRHDQRGR